MVGHLRARIVLVVAMLAGLVPFIANELIWTRSDLAQQLEAIDKSMAEPRRVCRRPFRLSYAAMAASSSMA